MVTQTLDPLELKRRIVGAKFTELAQRTGISYKRIWRFFRDDGPLTRLEMARIDAALDEAGASATDQNAQDRPGVTAEARS